MLLLLFSACGVSNWVVKCYFCTVQDAHLFMINVCALQIKILSSLLILLPKSARVTYGQSMLTPSLQNVKFLG